MACGPAGIPAKCGNRVVSRQKLFRALVGMIAVSGLLQGFHNVARVDLPSSVWGAGETGVGLLQAVAAGSTVAGALLFLSAPKYFSRSGLAVAITIKSERQGGNAQSLPRSASVMVHQAAITARCGLN